MVPCIGSREGKCKFFLDLAIRGVANYMVIASRDHSSNQTA